MNFDLPTSITVHGKEYLIRDKGDYRVILDVIDCLNDNDLLDSEKAEIALSLFLDGEIKDSKFAGEFPDDLQKALDEMMIFINCGETVDDDDGKPAFMDWAQDMWMIAPEVNHVLGYEIREQGRYTHWWTFKGAFLNIKDGMFCTYVGIRKKLYKGVKLDNYEKEIYAENFKKIDLTSRR